MWVDGAHGDLITAIVHYDRLAMVVYESLMQSFAGIVYNVVLSWVSICFVGVEGAIFVASD